MRKGNPLAILFGTPPIISAAALIAVLASTDPHREEESPAAAEGEDTGVQIGPIIKLEEVTVTTGEEDEDVLLDLPILRHHSSGAASYLHSGGSAASYRPSPQFRRDPPPQHAAGFHPQPGPAFALLLHRGLRPGFSFHYFESLIADCPTAPNEFFTDRLGSVAARLHYCQWHHALDALASTKL